MSRKEKPKIKDTNGIKYKFPARTCEDCVNYPCFVGIENCVSDFAKYGCKDFKSIFVV